MKKNVQPAEAKTPEEDSALAAAEDVSAVKPEASDVPVMPFDLSKVDPEKIAVAEKMGIPIRQLIAWAVSVEQRFQIIAADIAKAPERVVEELKAEAVRNQKQMMERGEQQGQPIRQGRGSILQTALTAAIHGDQQSSSPFQEKMNRLMMEKTMMGMDLSNALTKAMIIKIAPEMADILTRDIVSKKGSE